MQIDTWDPRQYDKFQREREQPFYDLLKLVRQRPGMRAVDLGCGTGKLTRVLHERLQARDTVGIDRSPNMLAETRATRLPVGLRFEVGTIEAFAESTRDGDKPPDVIVSNAALHWVADHPALVPKLASHLGVGGQMAFQIPAQHADVTHTLADELARSEPYRSAFAGWTRPQPVLAVDEYARLLYRCGFADPVARMIVYPHVLPSRDHVVEWMKGTLLTEFARHLPGDVFARFSEEYAARLLPQLEAATPYFFPFKRILCWGQRA